MDAKELCTCKNTKCKLHPLNHDMGCTPCIEKNLKMDEMPNCFFDKIDPEHKRKGKQEIMQNFCYVMNNNCLYYKSL